MKKRKYLNNSFVEVFSEILFQDCREKYRHLPEVKNITAWIAEVLFHRNPTFNLEQKIQEGLYEYEPEE